MKKIIYKLIKAGSIGILALVLVTIGIDAADKHDNLSESIIGRMIFGEGEGPCPEDMAYIPSEYGGFCMDIYEASPGGKCPISDVGSQADTRKNLDSTGCIPESKEQAIPWRFVSQSQAAQACAKADKRLPTDEEWYQASLGTPDGDADWTSNDCQVDHNWDSQPGLTGSGINCQSAAGAYDMVGNVWEWVKGEAKDSVYKGQDLPNPGFVKSVDSAGVPIETDADMADPNFNEDYFWLKTSGARGMARGGYWANKEEAGMYAIYLVSLPSYAGTGVGFRCVK